LAKGSQVTISERELEEQVMTAARYLGWRVAHFRAGMTSRQYRDKTGGLKNRWVTPVAGDGAGFPDLVLVNPAQHRVIWAELKSDIGRITSGQQKWLDDLRASGQEVYVWRPGDWEDIVHILEKSG